MNVSLPTLSIPRLLLAAGGALVILFAGASAAQAACSYPDAEQVFSAWGDKRYYELAPDGGLEEGGTGWELAGGASLIGENEDSFLNDAADETSLSIPYGGSATSPPVCVDESTPVFRLMARNSGDDHSKLIVTVTYLDATKAKTKDIRAESDWEPTDAMKLEAAGAEERAARISFSPEDDEGAWQVDDLYVDPFARR
jgi:hypothetical protein